MSIIHILEKQKGELQEITCLEQFQATNHGEGRKQSLFMSRQYFLASSRSAWALRAVTDWSSSTGAHPVSAQCLLVADDDNDGGDGRHLPQTNGEQSQGAK